MKKNLALLLSLALVSTAYAQAQPVGASHDAIAPWVDAQVHTVMCFNLEQLDKAVLDKYLTLGEKLKMLGAGERKAAELVGWFYLNQWQNTKAKTVYLVWSLNHLETPLLVVPLTKDTDKKA